MSNTFVNSARKLYLSDGAATPTLTLIPTITLDESPDVQEETWYSTADVSGGVAFENGIVTGHAKEYTVVTKQFTTTDATPALNAALVTLKGCRDVAGDDAEKSFVILEPDGTKVAVLCAVKDLVVIKGDTENAASFEFKLRRRGAPTAYTGALP